jgi:hypothetical protein
MNSHIKTIIALLIMLLTVNVWAEKGMGPGMLPVGPFDFIPLLSVQESYNDNIFYNNLDRQASLITQIQGGGELALRRKLDRYAFNYNFLSSQYHSSPVNNYVDQNLGATAHFDFTSRNRLDFSSSLNYGHTMRGLVFSQSGDITSTANGSLPNAPIPISSQSSTAQSSPPIQYHQFNANINYLYGRVDAKGNPSLALAWNQLTYDNYLDTYSQWDRTQLQITPAFNWRILPKTYLTTQIQNTIVNYINNPEGQPSQDYSLQRYLIGATWDRTSKTNGTIGVGYYQQEFSNAALKSQGGLTYNGVMQWMPITYSKLSFSFSRNIQPSIGASSSYLIQVYNASWEHNWPNQMVTKLSGGYQQTLSQNAGQGASNGINYKLDVKYQMRPWLDIGANYSQMDFQTPSNNTGNSSNTQNVVMLYVHVMPHAAGK